MTEYRVLHYRGDRTGHPDLQPGLLLGTDAAGWPWEVLDTEISILIPQDGAAADEVLTSSGGAYRGRVRTTVHLQTATVDAVRAARARVAAEHRERMLRMLPRHKRRQMQREGRL